MHLTVCIITRYLCNIGGSSSLLTWLIEVCHYVGVGLTRFSDALQQSLTLASLHQVDPFQFIFIQAVKFSFPSSFPEFLPRSRMFVQKTVPLTVGQRQFLLSPVDATLPGTVEPVLRDGQREVCQVVNQIFHTLIVCGILILAKLLDQLFHS